MASEVFTTENIRLLDGEEVELRPLPISKLRKFMRLWTEHATAMANELNATRDSEDEELDQAAMTDRQFDTYIKLCAIGLESQLKGDQTEKQYITQLEDVLDEQTIYKILEVTGGLKLNDSPNQSPAMMPEMGGMN